MLTFCTRIILLVCFGMSLFKFGDDQLLSSFVLQNQFPMFCGQKKRKKRFLSTSVPLSDKENFQEKGTVKIVFQNVMEH